MSESSRTINHKLNELISRNNLSKAKLHDETALDYASILKSNILDKDKQEKVNSIVVLAKLMDCCVDVVSNKFLDILDDVLFNTLCSIVSINMSSETYKAILKITLIHMTGSLFNTHSLVNFLPVYDALNKYGDVVEILSDKIKLKDQKITSTSIKLVTQLLNRAVNFEFDGTVTLVFRLKHARFFQNVDTYVVSDDRPMTDTINLLKTAYNNINDQLESVSLDLNIKSHLALVSALISTLDQTITDSGVQPMKEDYLKAGFSDSSKVAIGQKFNALSAMDFLVFLNDPNVSFKKMFHEVLIIEENESFPISDFMNRTELLWSTTFRQRNRYPSLLSSVLQKDVLIYNTMLEFLRLWNNTMRRCGRDYDIEKLTDLVRSSIDNLEMQLAAKSRGLKDSLKSISMRTLEEKRNFQISKFKRNQTNTWEATMHDFNQYVTSEMLKFVIEQRISLLIKGSWVLAEEYGHSLINSSNDPPKMLKYIFVSLTPNRKGLCYKVFTEKPDSTPTAEELESQIIKIQDILEVKSTNNPSGSEVMNKRKSVVIHGSISLNKIIINGAKGRKLLAFYCESNSENYVWLDGIKLLTSRSQEKKVSEESLKQIDSLIELRKSTQLVNLEDFSQSFDQEEDSDYYDLAELQSVSETLYFR